MDEPTDDRLRGDALEDALASLLYDEGARARLRAGKVDDPRFARLDVDELDEAARGVRRMVRDRVHRGTGGVDAWFPRTIDAWRAVHPDDRDLDGLLTCFCSSTACRAWREVGIGISLEEAFYRFFLEAGEVPAAIAQDEFLGAVIRALAVAPGARFEWPAVVRRAPGGCYALTRAHVLYAALGGQYVHGQVTPLVAALLEGKSTDDVAVSFGLCKVDMRNLVDALRARGLVD